MRMDTPEIVRVLRSAAWMWLGYLLALIVIDSFAYLDVPHSMMVLNYLGNGALVLLFLGFAYWSWLEETMGRYYVPLMLLIISGLPIAVGAILMPTLPPGPMSNVEGVALRTLPILFIALVITAWQYAWPYVVVFAVGTAGLEIAIAQAMPPPQASASHAVVIIAIVQSVSFLVVGYFISRLVRRLRAQQDALEQANAQLTHNASTLENLTVSRERNRLARELHDTLAHTLSGLTVQLETAEAYWDREPETVRQLLTQSLVATRSGLDETRRALKSLRASPLEDLGLLLALHDLSETAAERGRLKLDLVLPERIPSLSPDVEQCIYRIAQESLENVVNHAQAEKLSVRLVVQDSEVNLVVQDDGLGADSFQAEQARHFGLVGMRERAELAGGSLAIQSVLGQGTCVQLVIKGIQT